MLVMKPTFAMLDKVVLANPGGAPFEKHFYDGDVAEKGGCERWRHLAFVPRVLLCASTWPISSFMVEDKSSTNNVREPPALAAHLVHRHVEPASMLPALRMRMPSML